MRLIGGWLVWWFWVGISCLTSEVLVRELGFVEPHMTRGVDPIGGGN